MRQNGLIFIWLPSAPMPTKRDQVVDTAYALFTRDGFHATGVDRIIAEAGVAKMTMYRHFPSKEALIVAVLGVRAARFAARLDAIIAAPGDPSAKIAAIFDWHAGWFRRPDFHGCLFARALAEFGDPGHPVFVAATAQKLDHQRAMQRILGEIMPDDRAEATARQLLMLIEGATVLAQAGQGEAAIRGAAAVAALLVGAASARP
ncbi:TetR/AcrR family transcriptional regulator [Methylobrevis albus]|uniref:TetR/AcrR family transcriptional regulator n=1 Tax=Methylobrevis albus TaxID=2793297 RepID=A0A931I2I3_9HYPH|nr:TetR/AcrR family transcriptional regulator [Methylobrevis albus]MBH0239042.1 TetR/AcrR family transcriptional regulator [Methylobrevis albus]